MEMSDGNVVEVSLYGGEPPRYASEGASGADVRARIESPLTVPPGTRVLIPTGLHFAIPRGFELQVRSRSGLAAKEGVVVLNSPGTIDSDYRGELKIILANLGDSEFLVNPGDRIAQLVLCPVFRADFILSESLDETQRGHGGFGSTGR